MFSWHMSNEWEINLCLFLLFFFYFHMFTQRYDFYLISTNKINVSSLASYEVRSQKSITFDCFYKLYIHIYISASPLSSLLFEFNFYTLHSKRHLALQTYFMLTSLPFLYVWYNSLLIVIELRSNKENKPRAQFDH